MFKNADKLLEKLGFTKMYGESKDGASYYRENKEYNYIQRLDILHKANGFHLIQSYVEGTNSDGFNNCVGLIYPEMRAAMKKYRELKRKYRW